MDYYKITKTFHVSHLYEGVGLRMSINNICAVILVSSKICEIKKIVTFERPVGNGWNLVGIQMFMRGF